jgi:dihydropyrimidine dehydrogenase (NAD+) subunit PreT
LGAGPTGLACAHRLARDGHGVTIYEVTIKLGGLNEYGITQYELVNNYAHKEVKFVLQMGGLLFEQRQLVFNTNPILGILGCWF